MPRQIDFRIQGTSHLKEITDRDLVPIGNAFNIFRDRIVETQFSFLDQQHPRSGEAADGGPVEAPAPSRSPDRNRPVDRRAGRSPEHAMPPRLPPPPTP